MNTMLSTGHDVAPELRELLDADDPVAIEQALDKLLRTREQHLFLALGHLARDLHESARRLAADISHDGVPGNMSDARKHLRDVLEMSSQAAHRTLDFSEKLRPQAPALARQACAWATLRKAATSASARW